MRQTFAHPRCLIPTQPETEYADKIAATALTKRQREVLELSARRRSAKLIADELGISEGRVNQHIANIKQRLGVNDLAGLHDWHERLVETCRKPAGQKLEVPNTPDVGKESGGAFPDQVSVSDAMPMRHSAPWESDTFRVGPGALDDRDETLRRWLLMFKVAMAIPALIAVLIIARWAITAIATPPS
ncbi:response regulator transcription factor [Erythrobacter litoralis]|uniref:response regulator transcription factor n=1 Tax=Erythrobacter litoralis TaxID=39960 RepID=UPI0024351605|nr:helix-turn-helix transcriptional regulator [Erythrobacter litoralis]